MISTDPFFKSNRCHHPIRSIQGRFESTYLIGIYFSQSIPSELISPINLVHEDASESNPINSNLFESTHLIGSIWQSHLDDDSIRRGFHPIYHSILFFPIRTMPWSISSIDSFLKMRPNQSLPINSIWRYFQIPSMIYLVCSLSFSLKIRPNQLLPIDSIWRYIQVS